MSSKKVKKIILIAVGMLCALICAACGVFLYQFYRGAQSKTALAQQVKTPAVSQKPAKDTSADTQEPSVPDTAPAEEEPTVLPVEIPIDFTQLAAVSPDIYAWLEVPDTQIDEPVLQHSGDDLYYNSHNAYGEYYMCGAVFSQETYNDRTFDAPMTILYGHGTVLGQPGAFHELNSYAEQDYFDMHRQMFVYTPSAMYVYRVFAAFVHGREHLLYYYDFSDPAIFTGLYILLAIHIMKGIKMRVKLMEERILKSHKISLFNRSSGIISGVKEVISFDPNEIILDTEQGMLMIQGEELHVTKLTVEKGEVEIEGLVYSMVYSDDGYMKGEKGGLLRRLFH